MANYYTNRNGTYLDTERDARTNLQKAEKKCREEAAALRKLVREYIDCLEKERFGVKYTFEEWENEIDRYLLLLKKAANYKV